MAGNSIISTIIVGVIVTTIATVLGGLILQDLGSTSGETGASPGVLTPSPDQVSSAFPETTSGAKEAATEYYQAAGMGDWAYTYEHLDSQTQSMFTRQEWFQKNQYYADQSPATFDLLSVEMVPGSEELLTEVVVRLTGEGYGPSFFRTTYWVMEDGEWLHRFAQEEIDSYMPDFSFEEFLEAQQ